MTAVFASGGLNPLVSLVIAVALILVNGLFVAAEFGLITARRTRIEALADKGDRRARSALSSMRDLPLMLSGAQFGITLSSLALGFIAEPALADLLEPVVEALGGPPSGLSHGLAVGVALAVVVFLHMVLGEMVPKNLALSAPEGTVLWVSPIHRVFVAMFRPVIWLLNATAALMLKPFGVRQVRELGTAHTAQELVTMIDASRGEGLIDDFRHNLLSGSLDFRARSSESLMIPWPDVIVVGGSATVAEVSAVAAASGHTRLPVVVGDAVLGFVHAKDIAFVGSEGWGDPVERKLIRRMLVVPAHRALEDLLFAMRDSQIHFAVVTRDGTPVGIVTLEDILESIVGEIIDETDRIRGVERVRAE
ncbi:MAG: hemolysin family protein [Acidimicrobiales bacterium]